MSRSSTSKSKRSIFVTGSADGLGKLTADTLLREGHRVIVHVRSERRRDAVSELLARGAEVVVGDFADRDETRSVAEQVSAPGPIDVIVHNAGIYSGAALLAVNVVAPYLLTVLVPHVKRHIYLSSGMHRGGRPKLDGLDWSGRRATASYSDTKLFVSTLAAAVARRWPDVISHSVNPGWVPTKMGGRGAPDDLRLGHLTQEWLSTTDDPDACTSGGYWFHQKRVDSHASVNDPKFQDALLAELAGVTGEVLESRT